MANASLWLCFVLLKRFWDPCGELLVQLQACKQLRSESFLERNCGKIMGCRTIGESLPTHWCLTKVSFSCREIYCSLKLLFPIWVFLSVASTISKCSFHQLIKKVVWCLQPFHTNLTFELKLGITIRLIIEQLNKKAYKYGCFMNPCFFSILCY